MMSPRIFRHESCSCARPAFPFVVLLLLVVALSTPASAQEHQHAHGDHAAHAEDAAKLDERADPAGGDGVVMPDEVFGAEEMAHARAHLGKHVGDQTYWMFMADRFEYREHDEEEIGLLDAQGWVGGDLQKFWWKSEAEFSLDNDSFLELEVQALYSRAISPYFNLNVGLRHDFEPGPERTFAVVGLQGLAPHWFEVDAELFLSEDGDAEARFEAEYEMLFTQRLVGQARSELSLAAQDIPDVGVGSGLGSVELGFRLRYEIVREFAPYVGYEWIREFGRTADMTRARGGDRETTAVVAGIRFWY